MTMKGRLFAIVLVVMLLTTSLPFATSVEEQALALSQLGILRGDGTGFKLDQNLTRAEALAFISRVKGEELTLNSLYTTNNETKFKDNVKDQWYTRYINYGVATGLVNGYTDGTFKPQGQLTDKAFIKLLLVALGYTYDADFTWDTVYTFAVEKGLTTTVPETELPIMRGEVVKLIYTALSLKVK